jgi:hypothetical protein
VNEIRRDLAGETRGAVANTCLRTDRPGVTKTVDRRKSVANENWSARSWSRKKDWSKKTRILADGMNFRTQKPSDGQSEKLARKLRSAAQTKMQKQVFLLKSTQD